MARKLRYLTSLVLTTLAPLLLLGCNAECGDPCNYEWWKATHASNIEEELKKGVDVRGTDEDGRTPLHHALESRPTPGIIALLLEQGADTSAKFYNPALANDGRVPLHLAAYNASPPVIELLLEHGADKDINLKSDFFGYTPLHLAAAHNPEPRVITLLLDQGADIDAISIDKSGGLYYSLRTPLHCAAISSQSKQVVRLLMERGADIHAMTAHKETPLHLAAVGNRNPEIFALLVEYGADSNAEDAYGNTPSDIANGEATLGTLRGSPCH